MLVRLPTINPYLALLCRRAFERCRGPWHRVAVSLDNLPRINQRRQVEADNIHLQFDYILVLNHGADDSILDFAVVQVHPDFVTDLELSIIWLLWGWHARNVPMLVSKLQGSGSRVGFAGRQPSYR